MDLVKTIQSIEKANERDAQETVFDTNCMNVGYSQHMPRKNSGRSAFDDEENFMGGSSISNFSKAY